MAQSLKTKKYSGCLVLIFALLLLYSVAQAAEDKDCSARSGGYCASLAQVSGGETKNVFSIERILGLDEKAEIGDILAALYRFALGLVGLSALIMIVFGGITYMSAGDSQERVKQAKGAIQNAIFGLILALLSYLILRTINPDLVAKLNLGNLVSLEKAQKQDFDLGLRSNYESSLQLTPEEKTRVKNDLGSLQPMGTFKYDEFSPTQEQRVQFQAFLETCRSQGGAARMSGKIGSTEKIYTCVK